MIIVKKYDRGTRVRIIQRLLHLSPDGYFGPLTEEAVRDFQAENGLEADGIIGPATFARLCKYGVQRSRRRIDEIIVHCTATIKGKSYTVTDIDRWHRARGWNGIGYHYVIYLDGTVHKGRDVNQVGAHCNGHNTHSIGVCYVGGLAVDGITAEDTRTPQQRDALYSLLLELRFIYPDAEIHGHRDFASKACPSFDATREYRDIK